MLGNNFVFQQHCALANEAIVLKTICYKLSDETIRKAIIGFRKRLNASVSAGGAHFEQSIS